MPRPKPGSQQTLLAHPLPIRSKYDQTTLSLPVRKTKGGRLDLNFLCFLYLVDMNLFHWAREKIHLTYFRRRWDEWLDKCKIRLIPSGAEVPTFIFFSPLHSLTTIALLSVPDFRGPVPENNSLQIDRYLAARIQERNNAMPGGKSLRGFCARETIVTKNVTVGAHCW